MKNDLLARGWVCVGKTLTVVTPEEKYFAGHQQAALREMFDNASSELGIEIPLTICFDLGTSRAAIKSIASAFSMSARV